MAKKSTYSEKLTDPRWQRLRLEVLDRDNWQCQLCLADDKTLYVHHNYYIAGHEPWEYPSADLHAYCKDCHESADAQRIELQQAMGPLSFDDRDYLMHIASQLALLNDVDRYFFLGGLCNLVDEHVREKVGGTTARLTIATL